MRLEEAIIKRKLISIGLTLALLLAGIGVVMARAMPVSAIEWFVIASGGGRSAGGAITLDSAVGQPLVGSSAGGPVSLEAGYWNTQGTIQLYLPVSLK
jgi:hypothetical protein